MIDWPLALSTVSQAIKLAQDMRLIDKEISQADLKLKIADLSSTLADLKINFTEARTDAADKEAEINRLKLFHRRLTDEMIQHNGYWYRKDAAGLLVGHPFCAVCFEKDSLLIETASLDYSIQLTCPNCKAVYGSLVTVEEV